MIVVFAREVFYQGTHLKHLRVLLDLRIGGGEVGADSGKFFFGLLEAVLPFRRVVDGEGMAAQGGLGCIGAGLCGAQGIARNAAISSAINRFTPLSPCVKSVWQRLAF